MAMGRRSTLLLSVAALALPVALGACTPNEELKYSLKSPTGQPNEAIGLSNESDSARLMRIARSTEEAGDLVSAASMYQRAAALAPKSPEPLLALADAYRELGLPENAEVTYRSVLALDDKNFDARRGLGASLIALGRPEEARLIYDALIMEEPLDPRAYNGKGTALALQQRHGEAQETFRTGLRLSPDNVQLNNNLALSLTMSGRPSEAVPIFKRLAALPDAPNRVRENLILAERAADTNPVAVAELDAPEGADSDGEITQVMPTSADADAPAKAAETKKPMASKPKAEPTSEASKASTLAPEAGASSQDQPSDYEAVSPSAGTEELPEVIAYNPRDEEPSDQPVARLVDVDAEMAQADIDRAFDTIDDQADDQSTLLDDIAMTSDQGNAAIEGPTPPGDAVAAVISGQTEAAGNQELLALADESATEPGEVVLFEPETRYAVVAAPRKATVASPPSQPKPEDVTPVEPNLPKATVLTDAEPKTSKMADAPTGSAAVASAEPDPVNIAELAAIEPSGLAPEQSAAPEPQVKESASATPATIESPAEPPRVSSERLFRIQLSAESSEKNAIDTWNQLVARAPDLLGSLSPRINHRENASGSPAYRLRTDPPMNEAAATVLCNQLQSKGIACFLSGIGRKKSTETASLDAVPAETSAAVAIAPASGASTEPVASDTSGTMPASPGR